MSIRKLKTKEQAERLGESLTAKDLLPTLMDALTRLLGPFKKQNSAFKTYPSKFTHHVLAGKPMLGRKVYALLNEFDFTPGRSDVSGIYGGFRPESGTISTTVNYCARSGILVVTSNLDVIDV